MLWKSLLTGTLLAGLAGAVVYFGTGGEIATAGVKADLAQAVSNTRTATKSVARDVRDTASETIDKMTDASNSGEDAEKDRLSSDQTAEPPKSEDSQTEDKAEKKWLDRYLNKKKDETESETERPEQDPVDVDSDDVDGVVKDILKNGREKPIETDEAMGVTDPDEDEESSRLDDLSDGEIKAVYDTALNETKDITIVELRDRAYLSLIDYTIRKNDFERSKDVISNISQPELRDTARSNIAVGLARVGKREAAFSILENVETKALSDVLRLQVIEAMTAPAQTQGNHAIPTN